MKIVNQTLLKVAEEIARKYGYIETDHRVENLLEHDFWGTRFAAAKYFLKFHEIPKFESVRYSYPIFEDDLEEKQARPKIELRVRFANPRIDIKPVSITMQTLSPHMLPIIQRQYTTQRILGRWN